LFIFKHGAVVNTFIGIFLMLDIMIRRIVFIFLKLAILIRIHLKFRID